MRFLILIHRYLGIAIGWVMALWCLSGFVMMYEGYPTLNEEWRMQSLAPLTLNDIAFDKVETALGVEAFDNFNIEMVADRPVLRARSIGRNSRVFDLRSGESLAAFNESQAVAVASRIAGAKPRYDGAIERDQWTVSGQFNRDRPLHHVALDDAAGTEIYVSSTTGTIVQSTSKWQRFWNWFGAVPHWLYPTVLRQHADVWSQVVIWLSLAGVFLTLIGLYIGIDHWRAMRGTKLSPYKGLPLWHHLSGLFFGVLALTWVGSGLVSMSPWGLFESKGFNEERDQVRDTWIDGRQIVSALRSLASSPMQRDIVRIESAAFAGKLYLLIERQNEGKNKFRVDATSLTPTPIDQFQIESVAKRFAGKYPLKVDYLIEGDDYYYSGHESRVFPVYRVRLDDPEQSRYYFDAASGDLLDKVDPARRSYRWFFEGLHRFDFVSAMRTRPWWDLLVIPLLSGVTIVCMTGFWMGWTRVRKSLP